MFRCCRGNEGKQEHAIQVSPQPTELPPPVGNMLRAAKYLATMLPAYEADEQQRWPEDVRKGWAESMQGKMKQLLDRPTSVQSVATIFRVPDYLRASNPDAYMPVVISLGPYHRHPEKPMDEYKAPYRKDLLRRIWPEMADEELEETFLLELEVLKRVPDLEDRVRDCYFKAPLETDPEGKEIEHAELNPEDLAQMLILDACFVVEFLFKFSAWTNGTTAYYEDPVIGDWRGRDYVIRDMLLLENQIPFFVLRLVLDIALGTAVDHRLPSSSPFLYLFEDHWPLPPVATGGGSSSSSSSTASAREPHHLLHLFREQFLPHLQFADAEDEHLSDVTPQADMIPSATELNGVGVTFRNSYGDGNVRSLGFQRNGTMSMPPLSINLDTAVIFRNLIAFEQGCPSSDHQVTSYAMLMYALVNTENDAVLLQRCNVLRSMLPELAVMSFKDMVKDARFDYHRGKVMADISKYWKSTIGVRVRNRLRATFGDSRWVEMAGLYLPAWWAELLGVYFKSPWTTIGIFTAFLLVVLTVLQTVFAILPYVRD